jgi:hypothetical protein
MTPRNKFLITGNLVILGFVLALGLFVGGKKMLNRGTTSVAAPLEVSFADACRAENDGKIIAVKGYLSLDPEKTTCFTHYGEQRCHLGFSDRTPADGYIEAAVLVGSAPGTMERITDNYSSSAALRVHTSDIDAGYNDYLRIVGEVSAPSNGLFGTPVCSITVNAVELAQRPAAAATPAEIKPTPAPQGKRK